MPCYFPIEAFKGKSRDASKTLIVFQRSQSWRAEKIRLPCGQCIGCRLERARQWAVRCVHEASLWDKNSFVTLTYADENLPEGGSLQVGDFQDFMKRLRRSVEVRNELGEVVSRPRIRYFHSGEYGERLARPHYHALLFNHDFEDKRLFSKKNGNRLYTSESLSKLWPHGHAVIGDLTFESAGYVARYALKKVKGKEAAAFYGTMRPEYATMSRRPGIGSGWFQRFRDDVYPADRVVVRGRLCKPPRFYDREFEKVDPSTMALLKIRREGNERFVSDWENGKELRVSDQSLRRLAVKNEYKEAQVKFLSRHKEAV